ncbi:PREDICTED: probable folate-biopterin transporter 8, chloroplastic [Ipomoea nil]|uniref:probable folate-biopterin transporter 8, chloroplastic n=1 Tax=Ipomoea nil TaxID=35883 RepID=UPI0009018440|nr:PREDICTED: probable folate-biopterin transporter 8, chloroplastic [Ipomoea nil]
MISALVYNGKSGNPLFTRNPRVRKTEKIQSLFHFMSISCSQKDNPFPKNWRFKFKSITGPEDEVSPLPNEARGNEERHGRLEMMVLCGFGYWVQGFKFFPWLALNFHMAHGMNMNPSTLQFVQNSANLPFIAKPLYGILSDALYIGAAHRLPYISIGVFLQALAWGQLALISAASKAFPSLMACVLLSNLGASITEVAEDALLAEYGQKNRLPGLQSYALMASAAGGIFANLLGGFILQKTKKPNSMFLAFASILSLQLVLSLAIREKSLGLPKPSNYAAVRKSILESVKTQYFNLMVSIGEKRIYCPLLWFVASILAVPVLSGSVFSYQTQFLNLNPSIIGMSKVTGQLMLLSITVLYDRIGKELTMRKLGGIIQILYAASLLLDFVLVKQINLKLGISNEAFVSCFSGIAEIIASFKLLPFSVLFASSVPSGCEGSLMSFLASAFYLSSITSGYLGVGLASFLGITPGDYSRLPAGIIIQFLAALLPLGLINFLPVSQPSTEKQRKRK